VADYNVDIRLKVLAERAKQDLQKVTDKISGLTKSAVNISMKPLEGQLRRVNDLAGRLGESLIGIGSRGGLGLAAIAAANLGAQISGMLGPVGQLANAVSGIPDLWGMVAVAAMAFAPQVTRAAQDTLKLGKASTDAIKGKLNADLKEATARINEVSKATQNTQQVIDQLVKGASLTKLNKLVSKSRSEMEGFWHNTRGAEQAAIKLVRALEAQREEQRALDNLVKKTKGLPTDKEARSNLIRYKATQWRKKQAKAEQEQLANEKRITAEQEKQLQLDREQEKINKRMKDDKAAAKLGRESSSRMSRTMEGLMLGAGFPMLFGGGAGAVGGGVAGALAQGAMGGKGFGAQILLSALGQKLDDFASSTAALGQALNAAEKDAAPLVERLGVAGTEFERQIKTLEKLGATEEAFALAREEMLRLVGKEGVQDIEQFGKETQELGNEWKKLTTQMQGGLADLIVSAGILKALTNALTRAVTLNKANQNTGNDKILTQINDERKKRIKLGAYRSEKQNLRGFRELDQAAINRQREIDAEGDEASKEKMAVELKKASTLELREQRTILEETLQYGEKGAKLEAKIRELKKDNKYFDEEAYRAQAKANDALQDSIDLYSQIGETIGDGIVDALDQAIQGTKTLGEVASSVFRNIASMLLKYGMNQLFDNMGGFGKFLSGNRASGGPVSGGKTYLVGEKGPELFTPNSSGRITSNDSIGGSNMVVNVDASGSSAEGDDDRSRQLGELIGAAVQSEIIRQQRPGGTLY